MTGVTAGTGDDDGSRPVTFVAFAGLIGKSRPYVSKLVATGVISGPAITADRLIVPAIARQQMAEASTRPSVVAVDGPQPAGTLNAERQRLVSEQANRQEMENAVRRGELISRSALASALPPLARRYADRINQLVRDTITDDVERSRLIDLIATDTESFIAEALTHGGSTAPA